MGLSGMQRAKIVGTKMAGLGAGVVRTILPFSQLPTQISGEPVFQLNCKPRDAFVFNLFVDTPSGLGRDPILAAALSTVTQSSRKSPPYGITAARVCALYDRLPLGERLPLGDDRTRVIQLEKQSRRTSQIEPARMCQTIRVQARSLD